MSVLYDGIDPKTNKAPDTNLIYSVGFSDASLSFCLREQRQSGWKSNATTRGSYPTFREAYDAAKAEAEKAADAFSQCGQTVSVGLRDMRENAQELQGSWGLNKQQAAELAAVVAGRDARSLWSEVRCDFFESQNELTRLEDGSKLAQISIDAWKGPDDNEQGEVIARVILNKHGDIMVDYHDNAARVDPMAQGAIADAKLRLAAYYKKQSVSLKAEEHNVWLDNRPYRAELLDILMENGIEYDDDAHAIADAIIDLIDTDKHPVEEKKVEMPDELVVRMAHYAGELEAKGDISAPDWDDLCAAIQDAVHIYYENPSETNPFHIEDVMDEVLRERFPVEPQPTKEPNPHSKEDQPINVLIVEPGKEPYAKEIYPGLKSLQNEVSGYIEAVYPFSEPVAIICNEEAKLHGLPLNRALRDDDGIIYDVVAGTFMVVGLGEDDFISLTPEYMQQFAEHFRNPEEFFYLNGTVIALPIEPDLDIPTESKEKKSLSSMIGNAQDRASAQQPAGQGRPPLPTER